MINWKLRLQNKTTLIAIIVAFIAIIYKVLDLLHIIPPIEQSELVTLAEMVVGLLVLLGIVVDPTTKGVADSDRALTYNTPYAEPKVVESLDIEVEEDEEEDE